MDLEDLLIEDPGVFFLIRALEWNHVSQDRTNTIACHDSMLSFLKQ